MAVNTAVQPVANPANAAQAQMNLARKTLFKSIMSKLTQDQGPEKEQVIAFTPGAVSSTPTSLRTDRKIKFIDLTLTVRITNGATAPVFSSGSALLGTPLFRLLNQVTIRGTHLALQTIQPIIIDGETQAELNMIYLSNYTPTWDISVNLGALTRNGALSTTANATQDIRLVLPIPCFPLGLAMAEAPLNCIHGPDFPGNLYVDVLCGDSTALGNTGGAITFSAYGSSSGTGSIEIDTERPLLTVDLMNKITSAVPFRVIQFAQPSAAIVAGGNGVVLQNLFVGGGRNTTRIYVKAGTKQTSPALTGSLQAWASLSDAVLSLTTPALDLRPLRFQGNDITMIDYFSRSSARISPVGWRIFDFISTPGEGVANVKAAFPSSQLTAARQFSVTANAVATANGLCAVVQEMIYGSGSINV
jgi:hypothetical protein